MAFEILEESERKIVREEKITFKNIFQLRPFSPQTNNINLNYK